MNPTEINKKMLTLLRNGYSARTGEESGHIKLPTSIIFSIDDDAVDLKIINPSKNMQENAGAFDSWAIAIKNWAPDINYIILSWERPRNITNGHYQRFLYRVIKCLELFQWLKVDNDSQTLLGDLMIKEGGIYCMNSPHDESQQAATNEEAILERNFVKHYNTKLSTAVEMDNNEIHAQLPMGVFRERVSNATAIFPKQAAQIDLWGLNIEKQEFHIFELKRKSNKPMGIYSQLFFYAMIKEDIINGKFLYNKENIRDVRGFSKLIQHPYSFVKGHFLATDLHPLIDKGYLQLVNNAFKSNNRKVEFDFIKYSLGREDNISITIASQCYTNVK